MGIRGFLENMNTKGIWGWAFDSEDLHPVEVHLYVDDEYVVTERAEKPRDSLRKKGIHPTGNCGFVIPLPHKKLKALEAKGDPFCILSVKLGPHHQTVKRKLIYHVGSTANKTNLEAPSLFFVHIQKTAGTAVKYFTGANFLLDEIYANGSHNEQLGGRHPDAYAFLAYAKKAVIPPRFWVGHVPYITGAYLAPQVRYVTMLREPVSRVVSFIKYIYRLLPETQGRSLSVEEIFEEDKNHRFLNMQSRYFADEDINKLLYFKGKKPMDKEGLAVAKRHLANFEWVGITEKFEASMELLAAKCNLKFAPTRPINATVNKEEIHIPDHIMEEIPSLVTYDQELYEFGLELFEKQRREYGD